MKVWSIDEIDIDKLSYSVPKSNAMGGQSVYLDIPSDDPKQSKLVFQTPKCYLPFGLNEFVPAGGAPKYSMDLSLSGNTPAMEKFSEFIGKLDATNIEKAVSNSSTWFKKKLETDVVTELYRPQLRKSNKGFPPTFKVKFPTKNNEFLGDIFDVNKRPIAMSQITKGCTVQAIVECVGMYFVAREFGVTWRVVQVMVYPNEKLKNYSFIESDDETEDAEPM